MICHLSLGINVSILLILLIFGVLFSIPLKLLLNTNYGEGVIENVEKSVGQINGIRKISLDYRSMKLCENFEYESTVKSVFFSSYDGNCTHVKLSVELKSGNYKQRKSKLRIMAENVGIIQRKYDEESDKIIDSNHKKSLSIAGHILAIMLIGSAIAALVEVLRAHFFAVKEQRPDGNTSGRRSSLHVDLAQRRHVRKDTIQAQKSFEIQGMMHRSPLRLIAARPPPLLRRSSFPAQCFNKKDLPVLTTSTAAHGRLTRRPSFVIDSDEESNGLIDFRRHTRLIRRH